MPNSPSAKKRLRQSVDRRARNRVVRTTIRNHIKKVRTAIAAGDTYQVNYTFPLRATFEGDPWALFADLAAAQRAEYCAYVDLGRAHAERAGERYVPTYLNAPHTAGKH